MGQRPAHPKEAHNHSHPDTDDDGMRHISVDANKIVQRLRAQRADLEAKVDVLEIALLDEQEKVQNLLARVAELESREEGKV